MNDLYSSSEFYPDQTIQESKKIHIWVIPIGKITQSFFLNHLKKIRKNKRVHFANKFFSPLPSNKLVNNSDKKRKVAHIKYVTKAYNRNQYQNFQIYKKILGVIGIIDYENVHEEKNLKMIYKEEKRKYIGSGKFRIFVFGYPKNQYRPDESGLKYFFKQTSTLQLIQSIRIQIKDFIHSIQKTLQNNFLNLKENSANIYLPYEQQFHSGNNYSQDKHELKRRIKKKKGDYCLLLGYLNEAKYFYTEALQSTKSKASTYSVTQANVMENLICIKTLRNKNISSKFNTIQRKDILDEFRIIIKSYKLKPETKILQIEAEIKFAKYLLLNKKNIEERIEGFDILTNLISIWGSFTNPSTLPLLIHLAKIFEQKGLRRKRAFCFQQIVQLFWSSMNFTRAYEFLLYSAKNYQLEGIFKIIQPDQNNETLKMNNNNEDNDDQNENDKTNINYYDKKEKKIIKSDRKWAGIQMNILVQLIEVTKKLGYYDKLNLLIIYYLLNFKLEIKPSQQNYFGKILQKTEKLSKKLSFYNSGFLKIESFNIKLEQSGIPLLHSDEVSESKIFDQENEDARNRRLIIIKKKREHLIEQLANDTMNLQITLSNPFSFDLEIDRIYIESDWEHFDSIPFSGKLPAKIKQCKLDLPFHSTQECENLILKNIIIEIKNLKFYHPINLSKQLIIYPEIPLLLVEPIGSLNLTLIEGQLYKCFLKFKNCGNKRIDHIDFKYTLGYSQEYEIEDTRILYEKYFPPYLVYYPKSLITFLPLNPQSEFLFPIYFCPNDHISEVSFTIWNGPMQEDWKDPNLDLLIRETKIDYHITVNPGIKITDFFLMNSNNQLYKQLQRKNKKKSKKNNDKLYTIGFDLINKTKKNITVKGLILRKKKNSKKNNKEKIKLDNGKQIEIKNDNSKEIEIEIENENMNEKENLNENKAKKNENELEKKKENEKKRKNNDQEKDSHKEKDKDKETEKEIKIPSQESINFVNDFDDDKTKGTDIMIINNDNENNDEIPFDPNKKNEEKEQRKSNEKKAYKKLKKSICIDKKKKKVKVNTITKHQNIDKVGDQQEDEDNNYYYNRKKRKKIRKSYFYKKKINIPKNESRRLLLPIKDFDLDQYKKTKIPFSEMSTKYITIQQSRPSQTQAIQIKKNMKFKRKLLEQLKIEWENKMGTKGILLLHNLKIPNKFIQLIDQTDFSINLVLQKKYRVEEFAPIDIMLKNNKQKDLKINYKLFIYSGGQLLSQDKSNNKFDNKKKFPIDHLIKPERSILWLGSLEKKNIDIQSLQTKKETFFICFLGKGQYEIQIKYSFSHNPSKLYTEKPTILTITKKNK
ncbi:trafficking protein particle complex subunit 9 [Anaeramoeba flamelloides]|uniref:Trafficking protein particle complex subunit 9 n=1 Tax=Anaeramoeba flamelloides TaxID=1746091 RepID=A0ABQ8Z3R9_9EUKA|nr:trafficking protein particle complex subunit 9 [Anaeramoeba flamelloides]